MANTKPTNTIIYPQDKALLRELGHGDVSKGIRRACDIVRGGHESLQKDRWYINRVLGNG